MARRSPHHDFTPKPEQQALVPDLSGNRINGLGERAFRRPEPIYWHDPEQLVHGDLQRWFYTQHPDNPLIVEARRRRAKIMAEPLASIAEAREERDPAAWSSALAELGEGLDLELLGIARMNPDWVFEGYEVTHRWIIMIGVAHDYERISRAPDDVAGAEVIRQYGRGIRAANAIANWIRDRGWDANPHGGPMAGPIVLIPPAIECGFGELGKHGSIINREHGSSFRLACVTTDLPLVPTPAESYGVDDFCSRCQVCSDACPTEAILPDKQWVRGEQKWYVDFDRCLPFFNEHYGCAICIAVCPWSKPGRGPRIIQQLARRAARRDRSSTRRARGPAKSANPDRGPSQPSGRQDAARRTR